MKLDGIKIKLEKPPIYSKISEVFGDRFDKGVIYTYNGAIYCKTIPSRDLIKHESVHIAQQGAVGADMWWNIYIKDPEFRKKQEVQAYHRQYLWARDNDKTRKEMILHKSAKDLSSSLYKLGLNYELARKLIQEGITE